MYTLSEHVKKLCPKCQYFVGALLLSSTALILLDMEIHQSYAPHVLNRVQVWRHTWPLHHLHLQQQGSCQLGGVFGGVMFENRFWREGIIFYFRISQYTLESMFPSMNRSSPAPAVVMKPQTMMLLPPCLIVDKALFSWYSSPGRHHTCWKPSESNKFTLDSSDHTTWFQ